MKDYFILDVDSEVNPDVVGNAMNPRHIMPFPSARFQKIIFDHIGHFVLLDKEILMQYYRILKTSGQIQFKTEHGPLDYTQSIYSKQDDINKTMEEVGFADIRIDLVKDILNVDYKDYPWFIEVRASK